MRGYAYHTTRSAQKGARPSATPLPWHLLSVHNPVTFHPFLSFFLLREDGVLYHFNVVAREQALFASLLTLPPPRCILLRDYHNVPNLEL